MHTHVSSIVHIPLYLNGSNLNNLISAIITEQSRRAKLVLALILMGFLKSSIDVGLDAERTLRSNNEEDFCILELDLFKFHSSSLNREESFGPANDSVPQGHCYFGIFKSISGQLYVRGLDVSWHYLWTYLRSKLPVIRGLLIMRQKSSNDCLPSAKAFIHWPRIT